MIKYKIFTKDNYFFIIDVETSREYSSHKADVLISKRYKDFDFYTAHSILKASLKLFTNNLQENLLEEAEEVLLTVN